MVDYVKENLRAPPHRQVLEWAKTLKVDPSEARLISDRTPYRHQLGTHPPPPPLQIKVLLCVFFLIGPGSGAMSHSKKWRETLPTSFTSPFFAQGDLGFFSSKTKKYGAFFLAVNSYTGLIHVSKISNTKMDTLVTAIGHMSKVIPRKKDINHHHHNYDSNV